MMTTLGGREAVAGPCLSDAELAERGWRMVEELELTALLVTRSEKGMMLLETGSEPLFLRTQAREVYDVTGAGDTLMAALVDAQLSRWGLAQTLPWAQAAASLSLQSSRAIHPGLSEAAIRAEREAHLL